MAQIIETQVVVIGGGVTGTGVLRDLAIRGIKAVLVEQEDLGYGTSTRNHGLLHSGSRYVVKDKDAAEEAYRENLILKKILPGVIEETGGIYVKVPEDDDDYVKQWVKANKEIGIPIEEIPVSQALEEEPYLNRKIEAAFRTPDGSIDPFMTLVDVVGDAVSRGAKVLTYHKVVGMITKQNKITGVIVRNHYTGEETEIYADMVINAAGPWAGKVAELAGIPLQMINNKGMLVVFNRRFHKQGLFRLRKPGDAEIFVPGHNVSLFGTTGINTDDPDDTSLDRQEMEGMLAEGMMLVPSIHELRIIRAFSGNRPLYQESADADPTGRNVTRGLALLDHQKRDGVEGFITITGGKLTTFRYMAEVTVDLALEKLGISVPCTSHEEIVPHREANEFFKEVEMAPAAKHKLRNWAGPRAKAIESELKKEETNAVICECEQVTWAEVQSVIPEEGHFNIGDIRCRTRLGMGPCQGTFCNYRVAAIAVEKGVTTSEHADQALRDAINERKKGIGVAATGETAKQLQLMETIYRVSLGLREEEEQHV
ncbi:anaerobic glycerol-3-phosphate dehydrogenase subunit GlpA [Thermoactinomyces mirandus]|uniref:Aerobic glycerol-3-phosphate dehydrogenase n=1 Tax=Thermoactinomyces mirandus TaxID=2756294 RepID=A0A7W1XV76_9BACL|nr:anaerobic glycerol-3-phosphate dehydrogenase subunit GlpA [Thermoactinomyces mirandus]MBA4603855.1 anaerobic glycerol-3-phosphate dehydrogenase subunit A [Thermoactinomyces mirandus]